MKRIHYAIVGSVSILLLCNACKKDNTNDSPYVPSTTDVTVNATLAELQQGRTLFINNCGACHGLYSPDNYTPTNWKSILSTMIPKTNLSQSDAVLVTKYVCRGKQ